jgi:pimeloyl-ACP methyl ester carboxylesterase
VPEVMACERRGVVLVHGGDHSSACWDPVVAHLVAPVRAVDLPGRGSRPAELAAVTLADCVHAVIDSADTESAAAAPNGGRG